MAKIYIVEDDANIREIETIALKSINHEITAFEKPSEFWAQIKQQVPDLVILDVMLPEENGYNMLEKLRGDCATQKVPVIMVTAKTAEFDMIKGLEGGADDYIKKPFSVIEFITRVKALLRRTEEEQNENLLRLDSILLDDQRHFVSVHNSSVELTYKEYELLRLLLLNSGIVLKRETIMRKVWGTEFMGESRTVDMHIKTLRQKLQDEGARIKTVRNVGYVIK